MVNVRKLLYGVVGVCLFALAPSPGIAAASSDGGSGAVTFGAVRPGNLVLPTMSVQFGGSQTIGKVIQRDLDLADIAQAPANGSAVMEAAQKDRAAGQGISYDAWTAAGVSYVLRGMASGSSAQAELYDVASRARIMGKSYSGAQVSNERQLAHRVADDVISAIMRGPGMFNSHIAVLVGSAMGKREVAVMDPDGGNESQLTSENSIVATPTWGRHGMEIFFTSYRDNNPDLYGITLDRRRFAVSRRPGLNTSPDWCEAAQRLAVTLSKDGNSEIYTMDASGGNLARLTKNSAADTAAAWSPDGSQIAFTSDDGGSPQIYVMSSRGGSPRRVSGGNYADSPAWSPDGKKIAYVVREHGEFNLYMINLAGGSPVQLTRGMGDNSEPSWAPDSKHLVFCSTRSGGRNVFIMNTDTKIAKQVTRRGNYSCAVWGPLMP